MVRKRGSEGLIMFCFMREVMSIDNITQKGPNLLSTDPFKAFDKVSFVRRKESMSFPRED